MENEELEKVNIDGEPIADEPIAAVEETPTVTKESVASALEEPSATAAEESPIEAVEETPVALDEITTTADNNEIPVIEDIEILNEQPIAEESADEIHVIENVELFDEEEELEEEIAKPFVPMQGTREKREPRQKFKFRKWMAIPAAIIVGLLVTGLIMGFIPHRALSDDAFSDWHHVRIYDSEGHLETIVNRELNDHNERIKGLFNRGIASTSHSMLRSIFEQNFTNSLRFRTHETTTRTQRFDEDNNPVRNDFGDLVWDVTTTVEKSEVAANTVRERTGYAPGTYVLEFMFARQDEPRRQVTVRDNSTNARQQGSRNVTVSFSHLRIVINDSRNTILEYRMYLFDENRINVANPAADEETVTPVLIRMNTSSLYTRLTDIREIRRGSRDNGEFVPEQPPELPPDMDDWDGMGF